MALSAPSNVSIFGLLYQKRYTKSMTVSTNFSLGKYTYAAEHTLVLC